MDIPRFLYRGIKLDYDLLQKKRLSRGTIPCDVYNWLGDVLSLRKCN